jgi:phosphoribosylglycinamide formyltransferase-1
MQQLAVLASGRGSNFQALIDACDSDRFPATIALLITDNPGAYAIERAQRAGIPYQIVDFSSYPSKAAYDAALEAAMAQSGADLFVFAGYMRILAGSTVARFAGEMINIHPALLPSFPGLHAQRQALAYGVRISGCTVHFVDEGMDTGPIILQRCVEVLDGDDEDTLAERILAEEHRALPDAVRLFCEGKLRIEGRRVRRLS